MGCGGADVGEDTDVSGDVGLCAGGEDGLGGGEVSHSFLISAAICFWSA